MKSYFSLPFAKFRGDYSLDAYQRYYFYVKCTGVLTLLLAAIAYLATSKPDPFQYEPHIARIDVSNDATGAEWPRALGVALNNTHAKGVLLVIDQAVSSGSDLFSVESAISQIKHQANKKPVLSFIYGYALGGSYVLATQTDYIVAQKTATLGGLSIAVSSFDPKPLLEKIGVEIITKGYGDLKVMPDKKDKNYQAFMEHRNHIYVGLYEWMADTVKHNRGLSSNDFENIAQGQWYLGVRALDYKLCDATGDLITAKEAMKELLDGHDLPVLDYKENQAANVDMNHWSGFVSEKIGKYLQDAMRAMMRKCSRLAWEELSRQLRHVIYL